MASKPTISPDDPLEHLLRLSLDDDSLDWATLARIAQEAWGVDEHDACGCERCHPELHGFAGDPSGL